MNRHRYTASLDLPIMAVLTWQMWLSVNVEGRIRGELPPVNHYANLFFTNILEILFNAVISGRWKVDTQVAVPECYAYQVPIHAIISCSSVCR